MLYYAVKEHCKQDLTVLEQQARDSLQEAAAWKECRTCGIKVNTYLSLFFFFFSLSLAFLEIPANNGERECSVGYFTSTSPHTHLCKGRVNVSFLHDPFVRGLSSSWSSCRHRAEVGDDGCGQHATAQSWAGGDGFAKPGKGIPTCNCRCCRTDLERTMIKNKGL